MGNPRYPHGFDVTLHRDLIDAPRGWRKPRSVFVNSMSDLFHEDVPFEFIEQVFATIGDCPQHQFQILTKRSERLAQFAPRLRWPDNLWMGVSVENPLAVARIYHLATVPARVRFLSCEPLLEPLHALPLAAVHWVICGGESGPGARPMEAAWVEDLLMQCRAAGLPFFFKQWGGVRKHRTGRLLHGRTYDERPVSRRATAEL